MRSLTGLLTLAAIAALFLTLASNADAALTPGTITAVHACDQATAPGMAHCMAIRRTDPASVSPSVVGGAAPAGFSPKDLRSAYNLTTANGGTGETVAIVDAEGDPYAEADLAKYRAQFGLPACTTGNGCFRQVNQNGSASPLPDGDVGWAAEISLDVDMVSAVCPHCHILLVEAATGNFPDLGAAVNTAVRMGAKFVSNSYGGSEYATETATDAAFYHHPGVAITASTGDSGYGMSYPAASADVTAVGGTTLKTAGNSRGWSETAWSHAGSGCSTYEPKPTFQAAVATGCAKRADADVAAVADPATGVAAYDTYGANGWGVYGGTSAASPIIASVYALAGNPAATDMPAAYPYAHASKLNDVASGSNGACASVRQCTAGAGWDGPTGLGTPNGTAAFTASTIKP